MFEAYGWPTPLSDEELLARLVALNAERAAEEARGLIRWLRPEFQAPRAGEQAVQGKLELPEEAGEQASAGAGGKKAGGKKAGGHRSGLAGGTEKKSSSGKQPWPKEQAERTKLIQAALASSSGPVTAEQVARLFARARAESVEAILDALVSLGLVRRLRGGKYAAR